MGAKNPQVGVVRGWRSLALMASPGAPHATIDWAAAEIRDGVLTLPLTGWLSGAWTGHLADLIERLPPDRDGMTVTVTAGHVHVAPVRRGVAPDVHDLLEPLIEETNAAFASDAQLRQHSDGRRRDGLRSVGTSVALIVLALAAVGLQWADWQLPARAVVVVTFVVVAPGWALLRIWGLADGWAGTGLAIAVSLSLAMVFAGITVYAGIWSPLGALAGLAGITILAAGVSLARARRQPVEMTWTRASTV